MENAIRGLLDAFVSVDELRPNMRRPFKQGECVCASDGYVAITMPATLAPWVTETDGPNLLGVLPRESINVPFTASELRAFIESVPKVEEKDEEDVECGKCDGDGFYECEECGNDVDCEDCGGTGLVKMKSKPTGRMITNQRAIVMLFDTTFHIRVVAKVLDAADILGRDDIALLSATYTPQPSLFAIGDVRVCIMPCRYDQDTPVPRFSPGQK